MRKTRKRLDTPKKGCNKALARHTRKVGIAKTRFLRLVRGGETAAEYKERKEKEEKKNVLRRVGKDGYKENKEKEESDARTEQIEKDFNAYIARIDAETEQIMNVARANTARHLKEDMEKKSQASSSKSQSQTSSLKSPSQTSSSKSPSSKSQSQTSSLKSPSSKSQSQASSSKSPSQTSSSKSQSETSPSQTSTSKSPSQTSPSQTSTSKSPSLEKPLPDKEEYVTHHKNRLTQDDVTLLKKKVEQELEKEKEKEYEYKVLNRKGKEDIPNIEKTNYLPNNALTMSRNDPSPNEWTPENGKEYFYLNRFNNNDYFAHNDYNIYGPSNNIFQFQRKQMLQNKIERLRIRGINIDNNGRII